jgi:Fur family ferric uptake transcriptional regulator
LKKNTRSTHARRFIVELLERRNTALSHSEVQALCEGVCNRVTIYRILDRLVSEGLAHRIIDPQGIVRYALCRACAHGYPHKAHNHVHFSCEKCHTVTCLEKVEPTYTLPPHYKVHESNFTLSGLCAACNS